MFRRIILAFVMLITLAACIPATSTFIPTLVQPTGTTIPSASPTQDPGTSTPIPELASSTQLEASPTSGTVTETVPTNTPLPIESLGLTPTLELSPTLTATPVPQPASDSGAIQFLSPGPLSKLVSPFWVNGYAVPGHNNKGTLELYGEDGRLLDSELLQLNTPYKWAIFAWQLSFKFNSVGELGRLTLSTKDEFDRVNSLNSVHLLLLSEGPTIINPPGNLRERCVIEAPAAGQPISGGILSVSGKMLPYNNLPLTVELVSRDGNIVGTQEAAISTPAEVDFVDFRVDIQYKISGAMWGLLRVSQPDDRIGGLMYLYSQEVFLNP